MFKYKDVNVGQDGRKKNQVTTDHKNLLQSCEAIWRMTPLLRLAGGAAAGERAAKVTRTDAPLCVMLLVYMIRWYQYSSNKIVFQKFWKFKTISIKYLKSSLSAALEKKNKSVINSIIKVV